MNQDRIRRAIVRMLLEKIENDPSPSIAQLKMLEGLLRPDEVPYYVEVLLRKVRADTYPSIPMLKRIMALSGA